MKTEFESHPELENEIPIVKIGTDNLMKLSAVIIVALAFIFIAVI